MHAEQLPVASNFCVVFLLAGTAYNSVMHTAM
jgi:hypothetical protein